MRIYDHTVSQVSERGTLDVSTEGWGSGTYIVSITSGGRSMSSRVVVTK
jgi:hypothetical protein